MEITETEFTISERKSNQQKFDKRLIRHVLSLIEQGVPRRDIMNEYGMSTGTLIRWMQGQNVATVKYVSYTQAEKRSVVRAVEEGMSIKQAQIAFNIYSGSVIRKWIRIFKEENSEIHLSKPLEMARESKNQSDNKELQALQKALMEANLKIKALDTMIDIAEEQLKIDIRKKSGAKQSSK